MVSEMEHIRQQDILEILCHEHNENQYIHVKRHGTLDYETCMLS